MVADTFEIADGMQQLRNIVAVGRGEVFTGNFDEVRTELIFVLVDGFFVFLDFFCCGGIKMREQTDGIQNGVAHKVCHFCGGIAALRNREGRREQQTLIEQNRVRILLAGLQALITHGDNGELFKLIAEGQQNERGDEIECGMHDRDHKRGDRLVGECEMENAVCNIKAGKTDDGAEHVKVDMHGGHALCAFCGADGGKQRRDTCTDVLAHNDRQRHAERNTARHGERLQNAERSSGALDECRDACAD